MSRWAAFVRCGGATCRAACARRSPTRPSKTGVHRMARSAAGAVGRVQGSDGWQHLTGLDHLRLGSDIDLGISVSDAGQADAVARQLQSFPCARPRVDGELVFDGGDAVAWREWLCWRAGAAKALLVKRLEGSSLWRRPGSRGAVQASQVTL